MNELKKKTAKSQWNWRGISEGQSLPLNPRRQREESWFSPYPREDKDWENPGKTNGEDIWDRTLENKLQV